MSDSFHHRRIETRKACAENRDGSPAEPPPEAYQFGDAAGPSGAFIRVFRHPSKATIFDKQQGSGSPLS